MARCQYCGKEFEEGKRKTYCSVDCAYLCHSDTYRIKSLIKNIARKNKFDVKNLDNIIKAKIRFFHNGDIKRCPCDGNNPERFCGSPLCITDVINEGHCHCNLFWRKDE